MEVKPLKDQTNREELAKKIEKVRTAAEERKARLGNNDQEENEKPVIIKRGPSTNRLKEKAHEWGYNILDKGFTLIPNILIDHYTEIGLNYRQMAVITAILRFAYKGGKPFPAQKTLAEMTGMTDRTVRDTIKELKIKGYMTVQRRYIKRAGEGPHRTSDRYNMSGLLRKMATLNES